MAETKCEQAKLAGTPFEVLTKLGPQDREELSNTGQYRRLVGKLIYLTITKPDITFTVSMVSQFMQKPRTSHWTAVLRILKYLKNTPERGLFYKKSRNSLQVQCYVDSDRVGSTFVGVLQVDIVFPSKVISLFGRARNR